MRNWLSIFALLLATASFGTLPTAAMADGKVGLRASCYTIDQGDGQVLDISKIKGVKTKVEIGSVSKIFTSYWAISERSPSYRFNTEILIWPLPNNQWDVYLRGSMDPFFGKDSLQFLIVYLNKMGIKKIHTLKFDENFKYLEDPDSKAVAKHFFHTTDPVPNLVKRNLLDSFKHISLGYSDFAKRMKSLQKLKLPEKISMQVKDVAFVPSQSLSVDSIEKAKSYSFKSVPLVSIIKEMNRISDNYVANLIFESLGGHVAFKDFAAKKLNMSENQVIMYNGSGDRYEQNGQTAAYDEATCGAILTLMHTFRSEMHRYESMGLTNVMAVVGKDQHSTVNVYESEVTEDSVIAKTGTVDPSVSLAGVASTKQGLVVFASMYGPAETSEEGQSGRTQIEDALEVMIRSYGGSVPLDYESPSHFISVDKYSALTENPPAVKADSENGAASANDSQGRLP